MKILDLFNKTLKQVAPETREEVRRNMDLDVRDIPDKHIIHLQQRQIDRLSAEAAKLRNQHKQYIKVRQKYRDEIVRLTDENTKLSEEVAELRAYLKAENKEIRKQLHQTDIDKERQQQIASMNTKIQTLTNKNWELIHKIAKYEAERSN